MTKTLLIDGTFVAATSGETYPIISPVTAQEIATVTNAGTSDVDLAVQAARRAIDSGAWPGMSAIARGRLPHRLADLIERDSDALIALEFSSTSMPEAFARAANIGRAAPFLRYNAGWADKLVGETTPVDAPCQWAMTVREPVGVVGTITSWNVPLINAIGKAIVAAAASLKHVTLELGGKSPVIILSDADLAKAGATAAAGIFANAGLVCIAGSRLFVHHSVADEVIARIVARAQTLRVGAGGNAEIGPLISRLQRDRVLDYLESAKAEGMSCLAGGEALPSPGFFIQPMVLNGNVAQARVLQEEIFGPVLCVTIFDDDELADIARKVNGTEYRLSANIWARDISRALGLARLIQTGSVRINGGTGCDVTVPFGGYKQSGIGRENGGEGIRHLPRSRQSPLRCRSAKLPCRGIPRASRWMRACAFRANTQSITHIPRSIGQDAYVRPIYAAGPATILRAAPDPAGKQSEQATPR